MAGQKDCVGAGFIMMTVSGSLMQSGSGTPTEFKWPPPNHALQRTRLGRFRLFHSVIGFRLHPRAGSLSLGR